MRKGASIVAVLAVTASLAIGATAQAAVTIGSNVADAPDDDTPCNAVPCTITNLALSTDLAPGGFTSPVNGTVISWWFSDQFGATR